MGMLSSQPKRKWASPDDPLDDEVAAMTQDIENEAPPSSFELSELDWPATQAPTVSTSTASTGSIINKTNTHARSTPSNAVLDHRNTSSHNNHARNDASTSASSRNIVMSNNRSAANDRFAASTSAAASSSSTVKASGPTAASTDRSKPTTAKTTSSAFTQPRYQTSAATTKPSIPLRNPTSGLAPSSTSAAVTKDKQTANANFMRSMSAAANPSRTTSHSSLASSTSNSQSNSQPTKKRVMPWESAPRPDLKKAKSTGTTALYEFPIGPKGSTSASSSRARHLTDKTLDIKRKVLLSPEQQMVLKLVVNDAKNVFFTGSAGTGKSVLLREIIASLQKKYKSSSDAIAITASTGMAACNIGGITIHSFAGVGIATESAEHLIAKVRKNKNARSRWQRVKVLVIDEVSMVDGILFDKLAAIACALRKNTAHKPFGGIQIVITGDFFQLPPVAKGVATFAFEAKTWDSCIDHTVNLTQVFRQKDPKFIDMLNEMRLGALSEKSIREFKSLTREPIGMPPGVSATELYPRREEVARSNVIRLRELPGEVVKFRSEDWPPEAASNAPGASFPNGYNPAASAKNILSNFMAPESLELKVGAQVMLIKNLDATLVNGTIGKVVGFGFQELENENDMDWGEGTNNQIEYEKKNAKLLADVASGKAEQSPRIAWNVPGGDVEIKLMTREEFKVEDVKGQKVAGRKQYPIILAWAMSIHKAQGQTLPYVKVDLNKVFEKGQSYVALSRAMSLEGLQVQNFNESKVLCHQKVVEWSKQLQVLR